MLSLLWLLACTHATPPVSMPNAPVTLRGEMGAHFAEALDLEDAVIAGDLSGARAAGQRLVDVAVSPQLPDLWRPYLADTQAAGAAAASAADIPAAAEATADALLSCGECHKSTGSGPTWSIPSPPSGPPMAVHRYGALWMGYGLIGPSDPAWQDGATALITSPIPAEGPGGLEVRIRTLALEARETTDREARARNWAKLLATCADCHSRSR